MPLAISPDGSRLVYHAIPKPEADYDLMVLRLNGPSQPEPLVQTPADERNAEISPDGRWLAYESSTTRRSQIYVRPFPNVGDGEYQVSTDGGRTPVWAPNGRELYSPTIPASCRRRFDPRQHSAPVIRRGCLRTGRYYWMHGRLRSADIARMT